MATSAKNVKKKKSKISSKEADAPLAQALPSQAFKVSTVYYFYLLLILTMPLGLILRLLYVNTLEAQSVGLIYAFIGLFGLITLFVNLGYTYSLQYYVSRYFQEKKLDKIRSYVWITLLIQLGTILIIGAVLYAMRDILSESFFKFPISSLIFFSFFVYFLAANLMQTLNDVLIALEKSVVSQTVYLIQMLLLVGSSILVWLIGASSLSYYALFWGASLVIGLVLTFGAVYKIAPWLFTNVTLRWHEYWDFFKHALTAFFANMSFQILTKVDIFMITYFLTLSAVADYTNVLAITDTLASFFSSVAIVLIPYISVWNATKQYDRVHQMISVIYDLFIYFAAPIILIISLFPEQIIQLLYGEAYAHIYGLLLLLSVGVLLRVLIQYNISCIVGLGLTNKLYVLMIPSILVNIVLNFILIHVFGLYGVAIATMVGWLFILFGTFYFIQKKIKKVIRLESVAKTILLLGVFFVCVFIFKRIELINYYVNALVTLVVSFIIYYLLGYFWNIYSFSRILVFVPEKFVAPLKSAQQKYFPFIK